MRRKLAACLLLVLSLGLGLDFAVTPQRICTVTFHQCCSISGACCESGCCDSECDRGCCLEFEESDEQFVAPKPIPQVESPFLADLPRKIDRFLLAADSCERVPADVAPDPPPPSGRALLALVQRQLI